MSRFLTFLRDDHGQDLIENTLLMAFVALACVAMFASAGGSINSIWTSGSATLDQASSLTSGTAGASGSSGSTGSTGTTGSSGVTGNTGCDHCGGDGDH
jgi:Flp pilus assembly pilin Flp